MTSILSDIAGFGRSSGLLERYVTRERFPVLSASYDASAALERGTALLMGGLDGTLGQTLRSLSLTSQVGSLGARLGLGSIQTGSLSRGLWAAPMAMPMFPMFGGMWPGLMGGTMLGGGGPVAGGPAASTTPRGMRPPEQRTPAAPTTSTAKSDAKPDTAAKTPATSAGAKGTAKAGAVKKSGPTPAEKAEQQWKKAAERVVKAVQKNKGLKDAISVTVNVVGRQITVTPKPGAKPSEKQLTAFVKAITKLVSGKGPLGGSTLVIGGKKYDGKITVAELVKTLMPAAPPAVVVQGAPSAPDPSADPWAKAAKAFELELNKRMRPDADGDENALSVVFNAGTKTITVTTDYFPVDADCADPAEVRAVLNAAIQAVNGAGPLKGSTLIVGAKTYQTSSAVDISDMLQQFAAPAPSPPAKPEPQVAPVAPVRPTVPPSRPTATPGDPDTQLTPEVLADNARFAQQVLNGVSKDIPGFDYSWQFGPAKELVMAKIAQIKAAQGLAADAAVPPAKAEAVARAVCVCEGGSTRYVAG